MKWQKDAAITPRIQEVLYGTYGFNAPEDLDRYWPASLNAPLMWSLFALMAIGLLADWRSPVRRYLAMVAAGTFVAFVGLAAVTAVVNRYLIGMMPAVVLLAALGVAALCAGRWSRYLAGAWLTLFGAGVLLQSLDTLAAPRKYDWRPVASLLHDAGVRQATLHTDFGLLWRELGYYVEDADAIAYEALRRDEPIDGLWQKAADLPVAWFVLSAWRDAPPKPTPTAIVCTWPFGKRKVVMVARDRTVAPDAIRGDLADPRTCLTPST